MTCVRVCENYKRFRYPSRSIPATSSKEPLFGEAVTFWRWHSREYTDRFGKLGATTPSLNDGPLHGTMNSGNSTQRQIREVSYAAMKIACMLGWMLS